MTYHCWWIYSRNNLEKGWQEYCKLNKRDPRKFTGIDVADRDIRTRREKANEKQNQKYHANKSVILAQIREYRNRPEIKARKQAYDKARRSTVSQLV